MGGFCRFRKAVKSPYEIQHLPQHAQSSFTGEKSYLPWPPSGLDWLYLMLREGEDLVVLRLPKEVIARLELKPQRCAAYARAAASCFFVLDLTLPPSLPILP